VKTPAKKATKATAKAPAKVAKPAKKVSAKPAVKAKPAQASASKAKPAAKPVAKSKPVAKTPAKAAAKVVKKAPAKVPAKAPAKAPVKATGKVSVKAPAKTKASAPKAASAKVAATKSAASPKPLTKALAPKAPAPKAAPPKVAAAAPQAAKASTAAKAEAKPAAVPSPVAAPAAAPAAAGLPVRSSRPSARLAQITVPSMPQAVASTAAKATFLPSMSTTVLPVPTATVKKDPKLANNWKNKSVEQLSDAEVLAMPDDEYMNDAQMAFFRLKLVQLKQGILSNAGETTEHLREDTVVVPDPADRATIEEEHALELRTRDRERKLLKKIEQSIARIDAGDYGYCDETGEPIGVGRLLARPTATLSLEAQQRRELKQKMFGD
jgi:DnaK suppressor protein